MREDVVTAIADEISETRGLEIASVRRTLRRLLPDADTWMLLPEEDTALVVLLILHERALFRVSLRRRERDAWTLACTRVPLDPASAIVQLEETAERSRSDASEIRRRTWEFRLRGLDDPLRLAADRSGSEDFAHAVATAIGWKVPNP